MNEQSYGGYSLNRSTPACRSRGNYPHTSGRSLDDLLEADRLLGDYPLGLSVNQILISHGFRTSISLGPPVTVITPP
jgi:hypothetical protein